VLNACAALLVLLLVYYSAERPYIFPAPRIYVLKTFGLIEGEAVRLMNPDGTNFPW
jgi:hypothetical protein